jgi:hypothetical protein
MAEFTSRFAELSFYINGEAVSFREGRLVTEDQAVIEAARNLVDAVEVNPPKTEEKPAKAPAKSSEK